MNTNEYRREVDELLQEIDAQRQQLYRAKAAGARVPVTELQLTQTRERLAQLVHGR